VKAEVTRAGSGCMPPQLHMKPWRESETYSLAAVFMVVVSGGYVAKAAVGLNAALLCWIIHCLYYGL